MKKIKNIIAILICGIALLASTTTVTNGSEPIGLCPTVNITTSCGTRHNVVACTTAQAISFAISWDMVDCTLI